MAADLSALPDGFRLDSPPTAPAGSGLPEGFQLDTPHPASAALPQPHEAAAQAELSAKQVADMLSQAGARMRQNAIPQELRGYTPQELAQPGSFINPRTGQQSTVGGDQAHVPVLDSPVEGGKQVVQGVEQMAQPSLLEKAGGLHKILGGAMQASEPLLAGALPAAPLATVGGLAGGAAVQTGTEAGLKKVGVPDAYADLAGDAAGLVGGGLAAHGIGKLGPKPALTPDNILGPERASIDQQLPGVVAGENDGLAAKQPVGSRAVKPGTATEPPAGFVVDAPPGKKNPAVKTGETKTQKGETNDNRNTVSVDGIGTAGRQGSAGQPVETQQGEAGKEGQASADRGQPAQQPAGGSESDQAAYEKALALARSRKDGSVSVSVLQRELRLGYGAATRLRDRLVNDGVLGEPDEHGGHPVLPNTDTPSERGPVTYGHDVTVNVPGEQTSYPARYAVRELEDVQPSHNPHSFERNPTYEYENDRDYSNPQNAARVAENATPGRFNPDFHLTPSPTAEQGAPIVDQRGNALGGNSRTMQLNRVYAAGGDAGYRQTLADRAQQFGLDPAEVKKFKRPILTRELANPINKAMAQKAITDFNKTAAAKLAPEEQAVADGRRLGSETVKAINGNLADVGEGSTLAQALKGDNGVDILNRMVKDGVLTEQEKNGYLDERGQLTGGAKDRIAKALVGRMFASPGDYAETAPSIRNNLERIAPHVMRVEDRPEWKITAATREGISALADAKAHGIDNLEDLNRQTSIGEATKRYAPDAIAVAEKLREGPNKATAAFRQYAQDADFSREGANATFFEPPTQREAFDSAFRGGVPELTQAVANRSSKPDLLGPSLFDNDQTGERSLFDSNDARKVAETAAADRDRLQRERMEAQLRAPISREEQLRHLRRSKETRQADLFGGPADKLQDTLFSRDSAGKSIAPGSRGDIPLAYNSKYAGESYALGQPDHYHVARMAVEPIHLHDASDRSRVSALAANPHAMQVIARSGGLQGDEGGLFIGGMHLDTANAGILGRYLDQLPTGKSGTDLAAFERLRTAAKDAERTGRSLILVKTNHWNRDTAKEHTGLNEELDHAIQSQLAAETVKHHLRANAPMFLRGDLAARAARTLRSIGYAKAGSAELAAEIGVRLMVPGRNQELGLTPEEGLQLGENYARIVAETYGQENPAAGEIRSRVANTRAAVEAHLARRTATGNDKPAGGGGSLQEGRQPGTSPDGRESADRTGPSAESQSGARDARSFESRRSQQAGLFEESGRSGDSPQLGSKTSGPSPRKQTAAPKQLSIEFNRVSRRLIDEEELPEGKYNYSGLGAFEDKTVRNLSQLRRASEPAHMAAVKSASSKSQAAVILKTAMPKIEKALKGVTSPENFRRALVQSRLDGIRGRWQGLSEFAERASDANLTKSLERVLPLLENLADKRGFNRNLANTAAALAEHTDYPNLRRLLMNSFADAAKTVTRVMDASEFNALKNSADFQSALKVYKDLVEAPMARNHAENEGIFSDALGPLATYYPLIPVREGDAVRARVGSKPEYSKPRNIANHFATGLGEGYDTSMEELRRRLTAGIKSNNKAALMDTLKDAGLVEPLKPWAPVPDTIDYQGQPYQAVAMETTPARQIISGGKVTNHPPNRVLVPKWLEKELAPVLQNRAKPEPPGAVRQIIDKLNTVAISGPADAVFHSSNLFGTLVANTPFLGKSLLDKVGSAPVVKRFAAIVKVASTNPATEESARDLQAMSRLGILPDRFGSETYSKKYAEQTGAELKRFSAGPILYGPKGVDVRARLVMYRIAKELNPRASGSELHMFTNQLGTYVDALHSDLERAAKHSGLSPFFTAGSTMLRNGVNAWTGTGPMPKSGNISHRIWQQLTGGGIGTVALWMLAQKAYSGKWPWEDKRSKLFYLPANLADRKSRLGQALWGRGSEIGYINFTFFNPLIGRGARALGIKGAADTAMEGGKWWQSVEAAQKDMMNSAAHPFLGPIPRAAFVGLTGDEPYLTGLRDDRARLAPQLMPSVRKAGEGSSVVKRAGGAAKELNSFYGNVSAAVGLGEQDPHSTANKWLRMAADLALPGLVANAQNPYAQSHKLREQAAQARKPR